MAFWIIPKKYSSDKIKTEVRHCNIFLEKEEKIPLLIWEKQFWNAVSQVLRFDQLLGICHRVWANMDGPIADCDCHCRGSKDTYVKYAAILNSLLSVSHAEQGWSTLLSLCFTSCNMSVSLRRFYAKSFLNLFLLWTLWNNDWSGYKQDTHKITHLFPAIFFSA